MTTTPNLENETANIRRQIAKLRAATPESLRAEWLSSADILPSPPRLEHFHEGIHLTNQNALLRWTYSLLGEKLWQHHPDLTEAPKFRLEYDPVKGKKQKPIILENYQDVQHIIYNHNPNAHFTLHVSEGTRWKQLKTLDDFWQRFIEPLSAFDRRNVILTEHEAFGSHYNEPVVNASRLQLGEKLAEYGKNFWRFINDPKGMDAWIERANHGINDPAQQIDRESFLAQIAATPGHRTHPIGFNRILMRGALDNKGVIIPNADGSTPVEALPVGGFVRSHGSFGAVVDMPIAAVHKDEMKIRGSERVGECENVIEGAGDMTAPSYRDYFKSQFPEGYADWEIWMRGKSLPIEDYIPFMVSPLNVEQVELLYKDLIGDQRILLPKAGDGAFVPMHPTTSVRTMAPINNPHADHMKVATAIMTGSNRRHLAPSRMHTASALSHMLEKIVGVQYADGTTPIAGSDPDLAKAMKIVPETIGLYFDDKGDDARYTRGYFLSGMHRENPARFVGPDQIKLDLSMVLGPSPTSGKPLIVDIMQANGVKTPEQALDYFKEWQDTVIRGQFGLLVGYGMGLEAHQQNCMALLSKQTGKLEQTLTRDFADGEFIYAPLHALRGGSITPNLHRRVIKYMCGEESDLNAIGTENESEVLREGMGVPVKLLYHTMMTSHLLPLIDIMEEHFQVDTKQMLTAIKDSIQDTVDRACETFEAQESDPIKQAQFKRIALTIENEFTQSDVKFKDLVTNRLLQTFAFEKPTKQENILARILARRDRAEQTAMAR